ncbi:hypothetical protein K431DRAFT_302802 [Polychaeton citri CBS 116435]|uniref:tRNA-splicing endonuclease n=1 Tax=Polychaeton citri CBS 116435 TaxID=1314669 RepID=A0A9P4Q9Q5_9PEZI|nr:hypothetical protein K431DRAFT_302802 [Polychaeton citri CBS 116435]
MTDVVKAIEDICHLDEGLHWFCPRTDAEDGTCYFDEDCLDILASETHEQRAKRHEHIAEAEKRRDLVLKASEIIAYDGTDAQPYRSTYCDRLKIQMQRCDICVREFHRARSMLKGQLEVEFSQDDVQSFMQRFDEMNKERIVEGLQDATDKLLLVPENQRSITKTGSIGMYALFEALHSLPFLRDEEVLQQSFDKPFAMINSRKKVKLPHFAPGMTAFLYSSNLERSSWAFRAFGAVSRLMIATEFEHSVRPFLQPSLGRVNILSLDKAFLPTFWKATRLILSQMSKDVISNNLRSMDTNIWQISLEHFQVDDVHFQDLLGSYAILLTKAPAAFWDAMGAITPQSVVDTILASPVFESLFTTVNEREHLHLEDKVDWVDALVRSVKPGNLLSALRSLLRALLGRFQEKKYSNYARIVTYDKGLATIHLALKHIKTGLPGGPVVSDVLGILAKDYLPMIMSELVGIEKKHPETQIDKNEQTCLDIIQEALSLDLQSLTYDRHIIERKTAGEGNQELSSSGSDIWKMSMKHVLPGYPSLPSSILAGIQGLLPLEPFAPRQLQVAGAGKTTQGWNSALARLRTFVKDEFLSRLESFSPDQLVELLQDQHAANGFLALLCCGDQEVHQSVLSLLKTLSSQDNRRDSLMHLVQIWFDTSLTSFSIAFKMIAVDAVYEPCPIMLKLCSDIYSCLCDSQDGILRSKDKWSDSETRALESFWQMTWSFLLMIFSQTEAWSNKGYERQVLQDFCRETMDIAESVFDQYQVFSSALMEAEPVAQARDSAKGLLEFPRQAFLKQVKWLRLRDEYLIIKAVSLTRKVLTRLKDAEIRVPKDGEEYIEQICMNRTKTKLTENQKAELQQALENHTGESFTEVVELDPTEARKYKQSSLEGWTSSGRSTPTGEVARSKKPGQLDIAAWSEAAKARKAADAGLPPDDDTRLKAVTKSTDEARKRKGLEVQRLAAHKAAQEQLKQADKAKNFIAERKRLKEEQEKKRKEAIAKSKSATLGAGTGVQGVGDIGKDHTRKGDNVMVSSDEESSSDDDDLDEDLFGTSKPKEKKDRRTRLPMVDPSISLKPEQKRGPTKLHRTQRNIKDLRARLAPDLGPLHRTILKWDFFHDGDYPPGSNESEFTRVENSFRDPTSYQQTFQPLLILEAWQNLVKGREENSNKSYEVKVSSRSNVDAFVEISSLVSHAENKDLSLSEGDIILLSKSKKPADDGSAPHSLARISRIKRQKAHLEVLYQAMPGTPLMPSLTPSSLVYGLKVQSITPLEREYGALRGLQYYDLCNQIVRAKPSHHYEHSAKQLESVQKNWNVNEAQAKAISAAMENEGFSLIQGPPGSGKTKTIVAIVGGLLSNSLSSSSSAVKINVPNGANSAGNNASAGRKLLVCAPSNAAVDELVMRLKSGVKTRNGIEHKLNVVRIGRSDAINQQVSDVTMEALVSQKLGTNSNDQKTREKNSEVFKEHSKVSEDLRQLYETRDSGKVKGQELGELESNIQNARKRKNDLGVKIDNIKDQERNAGREAELSRKRAQQAVIEEAHVICATLSGSGHDMFQNLTVEFETVIIDEAAQCVEMSSLIPLKYGCYKCIMVGDPKQLPPTVFSKEAARFQYEQSLFVRMQNNHPNEVYLLDTQYRMHPHISLFPSRTFYDGKLKDGKGMAQLRIRSWHSSELLAPYRFYDVQGQHQSAPKGHSLINLAEIDVAIMLFERLSADFGSKRDYPRGNIGVITPYKSQLRALKDRFSSRFGNEIFDIIEFNTTDAFQGRESEIIIFSCVRASPAGGIGFLQDIRRMNVGLTRAKSSLWVLGNSESLVRGQYWRKLVEDAKARDSYTTGNLKSMLSKSSSHFPAAVAKDSSMLDVGEHVEQMDVGRKDSMKENRNVDGNRETPASLQQVKREVDPDAMEGVRYRFEDRVKKATSRSSGTASNGGTHKAFKNEQDVEMKEMEDTDLDTAREAYIPATTARSDDSNGRRSSSNSTSSSVAKSGRSGGHGNNKHDYETRVVAPAATTAGSIRVPRRNDNAREDSDAGSTAKKETQVPAQQTAGVAQQQQPAVVQRKRPNTGNPFMPSSKRRPKPQN